MGYILRSLAASEIMISRRPKRRESMENAPGPRQTIATAIVIVSAASDLASKKFGAGDCTNAKDVTTQLRAAPTAANGVK